MIEGVIGEKSYSEIRREEDGEGLYRLIVEVIGDDGNPIHYDYVRAGEFPEGKISDTAIDIIYLDNEGNDVGGSKLASFKEGEWKME